jgi:hypothetical protein
MIEPSRHVPLRPEPWDGGAARHTSDQIVSDALNRFDADQFWPAHTLDDGIRDGHSSIYVGAVGHWGLKPLRRRELVRGRYSLWTGDMGLAIYLWDCLRDAPPFPSIVVF